MSGIHSPTVVHAFIASTHADATRPVMTFYDDGTGERTELSGATLANWVSKTANLLADGIGLGPGGVAAVRLPAHWQTAAILLGCWSAGLTVDLGPTGETGPAADVAFVTAETAGSVTADEVYALALAPLGMPFRPGPPAGTLDYSVEVRGHGDHFSAPAPPPAQAALSDGRTHADLVAAALKLSPPARVLIDGDRHPDPLLWLVTPLLAGSSIVLCRHLDPAALPARLEAEHATVFP